jgi:signal transduction histidine kinase
MAVIEVVDEGPGLPPDDLKVIGGRFRRGSTASDASGTGLGLFIAREMASVIGAQLTFSAAKPHGLCVGLRVPRAYPRSTARAQAA